MHQHHKLFWLFLFVDLFCLFWIEKKVDENMQSRNIQYLFNNNNNKKKQKQKQKTYRLTYQLIHIPVRREERGHEQVVDCTVVEPAVDSTVVDPAVGSMAVEPVVDSTAVEQAVDSTVGSVRTNMVVCVTVLVDTVVDSSRAADTADTFCKRATELEEQALGTGSVRASDVGTVSVLVPELVTVLVRL
jgi:hypothetical protein